MKMRLSDMSKPELERIKNNCNFVDDELIVFEMLARGKTINAISMEINLSESTVNRIIKSIKCKVERNDNMAEMTNVPVWEKVTITIKEAAEYSNIGINKLEDMLKCPSCPFVLHVGKGKRLIKRKAFEQYIEKRDAI